MEINDSLPHFFFGCLFSSPLAFVCWLSAQFNSFSICWKANAKAQKINCHRNTGQVEQLASWLVLLGSTSSFLVSSPPFNRKNQKGPSQAKTGRKAKFPAGRQTPWPYLYQFREWKSATMSLSSHIECKKFDDLAASEDTEYFLPVDTKP